MLNETWEDQYRRMRRSRKRLERAVDEYGERDPELHDEATSRDIVYHFCADAFHLKDYIKTTTGQSAAVKQSVEQLFDLSNPNASTALAICADVANGTKHLNLRTSRFSPAAEIVSQEAGITLPFILGEAHFTYHFVIEAGGATYSELDIAQGATADWDTWLVGNGFVLPT